MNSNIEAFKFALGRDNSVWSMSYDASLGIRYRPNRTGPDDPQPLFFDSQLSKQEAEQLRLLLPLLPESYSENNLGLYRNDGEPEANAIECLSFEYGSAKKFYMAKDQLIHSVFEKILLLMSEIKSRIDSEMK